MYKLTVYLFFIQLVVFSTAFLAGPRILFSKEGVQYRYSLKVNVSAGARAPNYSDNHWLLDGRLLVHTYDNFTKVRYKMEIEKMSAFSQSQAFLTYQSQETAKYLQEPWEVDYQDNGFIGYLYVGAEPVWATNMKRAISINFQVAKQDGTYTIEEPCLYDSCIMTYVARDKRIKKYNSMRFPYATQNKWSSVPDILTPDYITDTITTAERLYQFEDSMGLNSLELKGGFQYKTHNHILFVSTRLSLWFDCELPVPRADKLNTSKTTVQYLAHDFNDPSNSIRNRTQDELTRKTYQILVKIASKGIDGSTLIKNASMIHNLDFVDLLNTMSQLSYASLKKLFDDVVLGTSYDVETSRNIFLEVLPHVRTRACALFVKYLVIDQKDKLEDATVLALIRKLPFNIASHSQQLLEELEVFTKLGFDFNQDIRHAGILSFATLVYKAKEAKMVKRDYFDTIVVKYFRMYSDCPQYIDKLIWLHGLCNIGYSAESYTRNIYGEFARNRQERLWAMLAAGQNMASKYTVLETTLPILTNEAEHITLRIAALHTFLSSDVQASDFIYVHNYIQNSDNDQLKKFWYATVKSLRGNRFYNGYKSASYYVPFVISQITNPGPAYWGTSNYISQTRDESPASLQLLSVANSLTAMPTFVAFKLSTGGITPQHIAVYILAEGLSNTRNQLNLSPEINSLDDITIPLLNILKEMRVKAKTKEKIHIDLVLQIHDKTVFATHINQSRFETLNPDNLKRSMEDFLRFGSHINQQMVYYPLQRDVNIPTEIGTPIRLQSTLVSFMSVRGNLTVNRAENSFTWRNDINIRYRGTAVTSLSTDGPLLQTEHTALIQQSIVGHMNLKADILVLQKPVAIEVHWPGPGFHHGSVAMHSRSQVVMETADARDAYTVKNGKGEGEVKDNAIFFDCDQPSGSEILEKLFSTDKRGVGFLLNANPSQLLLNSVLLLTSPPSGPCGLVLPPRWSWTPNDHVLEARVSMDSLDVALFPLTTVTVKIGHSLILRDNHSNGKMHLNVTGDTVLVFFEKTKNKTMETTLITEIKSPSDEEYKKWKTTIRREQTSDVSIDKEISNDSSAFEGTVSVNWTDYKQNRSGELLVVQYHGVNGEDQNEFYMEMVPSFISTKEDGIFDHRLVGQSMDFMQISSNMSILMKEKNGQVDLMVNGERYRFESELMSLLMEQWDTLPFYKKYGIYRKCTIEDSIVKTFTGKTSYYSAECFGDQCSENLLIVADCTETPAFAITRRISGDGVTLHTNNVNVSVIWFKGVPCLFYNDDYSKVDYDEKNEYCSRKFEKPVGFSLKYAKESVVLKCDTTRVILVVQRNGDVSTFVPFNYMDTVCGPCAQ